MPRGCIWALVIFGLLAVLAIGAAVYFGSQVVKNFKDPSQATNIAGEIVDFELPAGYQPLGGSNLGVMKMAVFGPAGMGNTAPAATPADPAAGQMIVMLMEMPANTTKEQMEQQMQSQGSGVENGQVVAQKPVTVRGQKATLTVVEGATKQGQQAKQGTVVFDGKGGTAVIMFLATPPETWSNQTVDAFLASTNADAGPPAETPTPAPAPAEG